MPTDRDRVAVFVDTQNWIKADCDLYYSVKVAKNKTRIFYEDDYPVFNAFNIKYYNASISKIFIQSLKLHWKI